MWSVIRYHGLLQSGTSWKINKHVVELWQDSLSESDSEKTSTLSLFIDENDNRTARSYFDNKTLKICEQKSLWDGLVKCESDVDDLQEDETFLGNGSDEDDSLLVIYQDTSNVYWQYKPLQNWVQTCFCSILFKISMLHIHDRWKQIIFKFNLMSWDVKCSKMLKTFYQLRNKSFK